MKQRRRFTEAEDLYLKQNRKKSLKQLSKELGRSYHSVYKRVLFLGVYQSNNYTTHKDRINIRNMYRNGMSMVDIAIKTKWSYTTVRSVVHKYSLDKLSYSVCSLGQKTEPYYETEIDLENSFNLVYLPSDLTGEELEIYKELIKP